MGRGHDGGLIVLRQLVPFLQIDDVVSLAAAFPPAGVVVVFRDLVEAELLVVVGADPFRGVDRALLERRIDVAAGDLLRHAAKLGKNGPGEAADAHLEAVEVGGRLDLLAEPAAHLRPGIAGRKRDDIKFLVKVVHQFHAAAEIHPGVLLPGIEPERHGAAEGKGRILAEIIIGRGVAHLDGAVLHRVGSGKAGHDLAGGKNLNLEFVVGRFSHRLGEDLRRAIDGVERFREARGQPPFELGHGLRDRGLGDRGGGGGKPRRLQELTTFHERSSRESGDWPPRTPTGSDDTISDATGGRGVRRQRPTST